MNQITINKKKEVLIETILEAFRMPQKTETILQLNKLNLKTLELLTRGIHILQSKKLGEY